MPAPKPNYELLPGHIRYAAQAYVEEGHIPGDFLQAVIANDLKGAFGAADTTNTERMKDIVAFFYHEVPAPAWGSKEQMYSWAEQQRGEDPMEFVD